MQRRRVARSTRCCVPARKRAEPQARSSTSTSRKSPRCRRRDCVRAAETCASAPASRGGRETRKRARRESAHRRTARATRRARREHASTACAGRSTLRSPQSRRRHFRRQTSSQAPAPPLRGLRCRRRCPQPLRAGPRTGGPQRRRRRPRSPRRARARVDDSPPLRERRWKPKASWNRRRWQKQRATQW